MGTGKTKETTCKHCNYEWEYKGMSYYALCPRCRKTTKIENIE